MIRYTRFGKYWTEDWPYCEAEGVGLKLTGYPHDEAAFIQALQLESCNPVACRRILIELQTTGVKYTTVMFSLPFDRIGDDLAALGVTMEIVPPRPVPDTCSMDLVALQIALGKTVEPSHEYYDEGIRRAAQVGSIDRESLGPYSHIATS